MKRKLVAALMALAAFAAFAVAASSASALTLTQPTGTKMPLESKILATNIGETWMTDANTNILVRCSTATMTGELLTNGPATATGNITANSFSGTSGTECTSSTNGPVAVTTTLEEEGKQVGLPYCMKTIAEKDEIEVRGGKCSEVARPIKYTLDVTGVGTCGYTVNSLKGKFTTHPEDAIVTLSHAGPFTRYHSSGLVSFLCPSEGVTLDMQFTLERDTLPNTTKDPIYIDEL